MPELDLFGEAIVEQEKKPAKKQQALPQRPQAPRAPEVDWHLVRPCVVHRISKTEVLIINSDCQHMFR